MAPGKAHAQDMAPAPGEAPSPVGPEENWLVRNIICQCGSCRHNLIECASEYCGHAIQDRLSIRELLDQGKNREQVIEFFIKKYGGQVALAAPIDKGFNRLAWLLPYGLGVLAAGGLGYGAYRMARRPRLTMAMADGGGAVLPVSDPKLAGDLEDKLEDELRNLD